MSDNSIDMKQALQIARAFNLAFNNAFMYGGGHQTTQDSAASFYNVLKQQLGTAGSITVSVERGSVFIESHCVDKLVSVQRIVSRFSKTGVQSVTFDRTATLKCVQALFYLLGALTEFTGVDAMQAHLARERITGVKINYVVYQKVTLDDTVVNKIEFTETQLLLNSQKTPFGQADPEKILKEFSEILSLSNASAESGPTESAGSVSSELTQSDYGTFISAQIKSINNQLSGTELSADGAAPTPAEMLENIYKLKESVLENLKLQRETGRLTAADELAINEINQISYQVIVRLIKDEYRNDRTISVKRLAQIIRRMLPDIKELRFLLPQLKDGLFAEGMSPADYLSLVKELNKELDSDGLVQVLIEASDQVGLTFSELLEGIKDAPEEAAKLIVLAAEIKKGGVQTDDEQMSAVLSDYIEKVSRAMALQSPEAASPDGGSMLKGVVTRIEREIIDRLKAQHVGLNMVDEVAKKLASQFNETVATLKCDWIRSNFDGSDKGDEETLIAIIEQVAEHEQGGSVAEEIQAVLVSRGFDIEAIEYIVQKAKQRAAAAIKHSLEVPEGVYDYQQTVFFLDREIKLHQRYNTPFSTLLISYDNVVDWQSITKFEITPDVNMQLTNQSLNLLLDIQRRELDIIGIYTINNLNIPFLILPMTEPPGAQYIKKRIDKRFLAHEFRLGDSTVHVEPTVTVAGYNKKLTPDVDSYLKEIYQINCQARLY